MFFKQFLREQSGCASYLVGDTDAGVAAVIDPHWQIDDYLETAKSKSLKITHLFETHIHADHISGSRKLAKITGAKICIHRAGQAAYADLPLEDGDKIQLGAVLLKVLHTPGHTPESIVLAVSDSTRSSEPWLMLTGDTLFIDDVGRPDLAGPQGASDMFDSFQSKILGLDGSIEVYPAHVAGSLCGRAMNLKASSTLGYERRFNRALQAIPQGKDYFIQSLTADLPLHSPSFDSIIEINRQGPPDHSLPLEKLEVGDVAEFRAKGGVVLDVRDAQTFAMEHILGSLSIPLSAGQFVGRVPWIIKPDEDILLVAESEAQALEVARELGAVRATGRLAWLVGGLAAWKVAGQRVSESNNLTAAQLQEELDRGRIDLLLDVREADEWNSGHIEGSINISQRQLSERWPELHQAQAQNVAVICLGGLRSAIATTILEQKGFSNVYNVLGGMNSWQKLETAHLIAAVC